MIEHSDDEESYSWTTPFGSLHYFPERPEEPTYLVLPDQKEHIMIHGTFKRMLLTLAYRSIRGDGVPKDKPN